MSPLKYPQSQLVMESVSQSSLKKHRKLRSSPDGNFDFDDPSTASLNHSERTNENDYRIGRLGPEKIIWILVGCLVGYFSNLYSYVRPSQWPKSTWKVPLTVSYLSFFCFFVLFVYLNYYLPHVRGIKITAKHWKRDAPVALPSATISGSLGFLFLFIGFLPHYHLWCLLIFPILFMSFFVLISLL